MDSTSLAQALDAKMLCAGQQTKPITCGYCCDLLSLVMARGRPGMAWVTVQTHMNVVAVAALGEMACVILPEGIVMEAEPLQKALEEGLAVLSSPLTAYEIAARMAQAGIAPVGA